ncbi:MAG: 4Fe-4S cluster-binding domain-containing protein, partial [Lachnospiraceae bacterium]|nr:4Fe-4S cluster-binding domain-containing protein [Lachnospiraceae bacterium]
MIHLYKSNGYNICLDVNSGSVHVVDDVVYDIIPLVEPLVEEGIREPGTVKEAVLNLAGKEYSAEDINEAVDEVLELEKAGQLFSRDIYENYIFDFKNRQTVVKALCLHIAHDCNLACRYCFAEEGEYHGRRALMDFEVGKRALDFLVDNSGSRVNLEVDFFGGEPTMN